MRRRRRGCFGKADFPRFRVLRCVHAEIGKPLSGKVVIVTGASEAGCAKVSRAVGTLWSPLMRDMMPPRKSQMASLGGGRARAHGRRDQLGVVDRLVDSSIDGRVDLTITNAGHLPRLRAWVARVHVVDGGDRLPVASRYCGDARITSACRRRFGPVRPAGLGSNTRNRGHNRRCSDRVADRCRHCP